MNIIEKLGITQNRWHYGKHGHIVHEFGGTIAQTHKDNDIDFENAETNGRLIAAAPEMLEALIDVILVLEQSIERQIEKQKGEVSGLISWKRYKGLVEKATNKPWEEIKALIDTERYKC